MKPIPKENTYYITLMGLLFALSLALTFVEYLIPPLPLMPPGVKLGLSNIVTMYCLFFLGKKPAFTIVVLKSSFVFLIRGATAFLMSLTGGLLSTLVMLLLMFASAKFSYLLISVTGAITHNIGQLIIASFLLGTSLVLSYFPLLLISGVIMGNITGTILKVVTPEFNAINKSQHHGVNNRSGKLPKELKFKSNGG